VTSFNLELLEKP